MTQCGAKFGVRRKDARSGLAFVAALLCTVALAGCVTFSGTPTNVADAPAILPVDTPQVVAPPTAEEREHELLIARYGGAYRNPELERYLDDLVQRLAAQSDRPDIPYKLTILNTAGVNAFALPSGRIYLTRGLLALANDDAEIAAVIAHEMAHVSARHALARLDLERRSELVSSVMRDVLRDTARGQLTTAKSQRTLAGFSRQQELDADQIGVRTIAKAGFDPYGASRFLASMNRLVNGKPADSIGPNTRAYDFQNTHPSTPERMDLAIKAAGRFGLPGTGRRDRIGYLLAIDGLTYGEDPTQGFLRGQAFLHPRLGFTFAVPSGFEIDNTPQAILGSDGDSRALRLDTVSLKADQSLEDYLTSGWIAGVHADSIESLRLNGNEAATATATGDEWSFRLYVIRFGDDVYRLIFASRQLSSLVDADFKQAAQTFRRLTEAELNSARPLKIDITTARAGDTVASLAQQMFGSTLKLERFMILNGFDGSTSLRPGDRVKIVRE